MNTSYIGGPTQLRSAPPHGVMKAVLVLLAATIAAALAPPAGACVLCLPYPKKTSADYVIESSTVVFARENPARPLLFVPVETLKGHYHGDFIPLLVDSTTARALRLDPTLSVVLAEHRSGGTWTRLGLAGSEYQAVLREIARWSEHWGGKSTTAEERARYFAPYLQNQDRGLAELAFLEIGRAPYATIRGLAATVERDDLYGVINDFFHVEWHALYILMLGMSDRPEDIAFIRGKLETAAEFGLTINLGAYATALIEMMGADAVKLLAREYFVGPDRSDAEVIEVLKALSVQGHEGRVELRSAIVEAYGLVLAHHPEQAGYVAKDLFDWNVNRFAPQMRELLNAGVALDEASELAVTVYVASVGAGQIGAGAAHRSPNPMNAPRRKTGLDNPGGIP